MTVRLEAGNCLEVMRKLAEEGVKVDAIVCDPPYHLTSIVKRFSQATEDDVYRNAELRKTFNQGASPYARAARGFMGKAWDGGDVAFNSVTWGTAASLLKPGGWLLAFGGSRSFHRLAWAIEGGGFEVRDTITWLFGTGFPKNHNVSKKLADSLPADALRACAHCDWQIAQDSQCGCSSCRGPDDERSRQDQGSAQGDLPSQGGARGHTHAGQHSGDRGEARANTSLGEGTGHPSSADLQGRAARQKEASQSVDSKQSDRQASTSHAEWTAERRMAGGRSDTRNSDGDSASSSSGAPKCVYANLPRCGTCGKRGIPSDLGTALKPAAEFITMARKPLSESSVAANVLKHGTGALNVDGCRVETAENLNGGAYSGGSKDLGAATSYATGVNAGEFKQPEGRWPPNVAHDGSPEVEAAFAAFGEQGGGYGVNTGKPANVYGDYAGLGGEQIGYGDTGTASRFFYTAKADKHDRWGSKHPTVKPIDLMRWLVRLVTPPGGVVLDPFAGSGTTGIAAMAEGFDAILIEREEEYLADIRERLAFYEGVGKHSLASKHRKSEAGHDDLPLFKP